MGNNYNFRHKTKPISSERIAQHMDFDALLEQAAAPSIDVEEKPTSRFSIRPLYWGLGIAASVALAVFVYTGQNTHQTINEQKYFAQQNYINPPTKTTLSTTRSFAFNAKDGHTFEDENGAKLVIPSMAFATERGKLVEGEIEMHYTEYSDYVDFFIAGIPMVYDSLKQQYLLESTGIVDIYATHKGQRIQLASNKKIDVEFTGQWFAKGAHVPTYNIYHLNEQQRNWEYTSIDQMQVLEEQILDKNDPAYEIKLRYQQDIAQANQELEDKKVYLRNSFATTPKPQKPLQPRDNKLPTFELDFLGDNIVYENQAEENLYQGTIWQVSEKNTDFDQRMFEVVWDNVLIDKVSEKDYQLTFSSPKNSVSIWINPVLTGQNYTKANAQYLLDLEEWKKANAEVEASLQEEIALVEQQTQEHIAQLQQSFEENIAVRGIRESAVEKKRVINRFSIEELGIWSCAQPIEMGDNAIAANVFAAGNEDIAPTTAYIVDKTKNTVSHFLAQPNKEIKYDQNGQPVMWMILPNGKVAIFENFEDIAKYQEEGYSFDMAVQDMPISEQGWRNLLE